MLLLHGCAMDGVEGDLLLQLRVVDMFLNWQEKYQTEQNKILNTEIWVREF